VRIIDRHPLRGDRLAELGAVVPLDSHGIHHLSWDGDRGVVVEVELNRQNQEKLCFWKWVYINSQLSADMISSIGSTLESQIVDRLKSFIFLNPSEYSQDLSTSFDLLKVDDGQSEEIAVVVRWHRQTIVPFVELEEDLLGGGRQIEAVGLIPGGHRALAPARGVLLRRFVHLDDTIGLVDV